MVVLLVAELALRLVLARVTDLDLGRLKASALVKGMETAKGLETDLAWGKDAVMDLEMALVPEDL